MVGRMQRAGGRAGNRWRTMAVGLALGFVSAGLLQGARGIYDSTEGRYCLAAREMLESGRWLEPTLLGQPHWTKPPLTYWVLAAGMRLLGRNEWAVRLPNVFFFGVAVAAVAGMGLLLWDETTGMMAGIIYATSVYPVAVANTVNTDTLLTMWELLALLAFLYFLRGSHLAVYLFWLCEGLGFFTKGPPALIPVVAAACFLVCRRRFSDLRRWFRPLAVSVFLVTALWWYLWECWRHPGLLGYFLGQEVVGRVAGDAFHRHPEWYAPLTVYGPCLLFGAGLWSVYLVPAARRWGLLRRPGRGKKVAQSDAALFLLCWFVPGAVIFSLSTSRMYDYVLPLFGAVVLLLAREVALRWRSSAPARRLAAIVAVISFLSAVAAKAAPLFTEPRRDMGRLYRLVQPLEQKADGIVLYRERKCYGLSFYAQKPVRRCHYGAKVGPGVADCRELATRWRGVGERGALVFVTSREAAAELETFLASSGFRTGDRACTRKWCAVLVETAAGGT